MRIQKQRSAIDDTRAPVSATPLSLLLYAHIDRHNNQILAVRRHQGVCRSGLHRIESVSSCYGQVAQRTFKDVHRRSLVDFLTIRRRARLFDERLERESVGVDDPARAGNDEEGRAVLEYGGVT